MNMFRAILLTLAAGALPQVFAHTELAETKPADRALVAAAPEQVELRFTEPVRLTALSVQRDGAQKQSLGPLPADTTTNFTVALPQLGDGHYVVAWRALSEDTHVMSGEFMFAIGASDSHDEHMDQAPMPASEHGEASDHGQHDDHSAH